MKKINIVIPMAGLGSRFSNAGFTIPKPLLNINGKPMIEVVCQNLFSKKYQCEITLICQKAMVNNFNFIDSIKKKFKNVNIIEISKLTDGQLSTVLLAKEFINNDDILLCANCDQYVNINMDDFYEYAISNNLDGLIMTMPSDGNPKWSYSKTDSNGNVIKTAEKEVISNEATTGIYLFKSGKDFINAANKIIKKNIRVNGEFYVCPCYNELIKDGKIIRNYNVLDDMWGLGTPEDLCKFLVTDLSRKV